MVERWINFYGLDAARAICRHGQSQPALTLRLASPAVEAELRAAGIVLEAGELLTAARTVLSGDVTATEAFRKAACACRTKARNWWPSWLSDESQPKSEKHPRCLRRSRRKDAHPGRAQPRSPHRRLESSAPRLEQLRKRLAPHGARIECRLADATALTEESAFDLALADVPCSGTGTLGRNPEIRHRLRPEDLARQAERQRAILAAALRAVRPGGRVVYSTCSLEPEENEQVVAAVLARNPERPPGSACSRESMNCFAKGFSRPTGAERLHASLTPEGALRLLPGAFHTDGFFIALIERTA